MKVEREVLDELVKNLNEWLDDLVKTLKKCIKFIENADTVEMVMEYKKSLLKNYVYYIPIHEDYCYFCIECEYECSRCMYRYFHELCGDPSSDWYKIFKKREELLESINNYYNGEKYD